MKNSLRQKLKYPRLPYVRCFLNENWLFANGGDMLFRREFIDSFESRREITIAHDISESANRINYL